MPYNAAILKVKGTERRMNAYDCYTFSIATHRFDGGLVVVLLPVLVDRLGLSAVRLLEAPTPCPRPPARLAIVLISCNAWS